MTFTSDDGPYLRNFAMVANGLDMALDGPGLTASFSPADREGFEIMKLTGGSDDKAAWREKKIRALLRFATLTESRFEWVGDPLAEGMQ